MQTLAWQEGVPAHDVLYITSWENIYSSIVQFAQTFTCLFSLTRIPIAAVKSTASDHSSTMAKPLSSLRARSVMKQSGQCQTPIIIRDDEDDPEELSWGALRNIEDNTLINLAQKYLGTKHGQQMQGHRKEGTFLPSITSSVIQACQFQKFWRMTPRTIMLWTSVHY